MIPFGAGYVIKVLPRRKGYDLTITFRNSATKLGAPVVNLHFLLLILSHTDYFSYTCIDLDLHTISLVVHLDWV